MQPLSGSDKDHFARERELLLQKGFKLGACLGHGSFSTVFRVQNAEEIFAAKILNLSNRGLRTVSEARTKELLKREITILKTLSHPNIVQLRAVLLVPSTRSFSPPHLPTDTRSLTRTVTLTTRSPPNKSMVPVTRNEVVTVPCSNIVVEGNHNQTVDFKSVILLTEFVQGETLFKRLLRGKAAQALDSEYVSANLFQQLMRAVAYMHTQHVVHRDIKPQNIMIEASAASNQDPPTVVSPHLPVPVPRIKLLDFGLSKQISNEPAVSIVGTRDWMAPEVANRTGHYDARVDCFSCGVVLHVMLTGEYPSISHTLKSGPNAPANYKHPRHPRAAQPPGKGSYVAGAEVLPPAAVSLVTGLLQANPRHRLSAAQALAHPWLAALDVPHTATLQPTDTPSAGDAFSSQQEKGFSPPPHSTGLGAAAQPPTRLDTQVVRSAPAQCTAGASVYPIVGKLETVHETQKHIATWFRDALGKVSHKSPQYALLRKGAVACREQLHEVEGLMHHIARASESVQQTFPDLREAVRDNLHGRTRRLLEAFAGWVSNIQERLERHNTHFSRLIETINDTLRQLDALPDADTPAPSPAKPTAAVADAPAAVRDPPVHRRLRRKDTLDTDESAILPLPGLAESELTPSAPDTVAAPNCRDVLVSTDHVFSNMHTVWTKVGGMLQTLVYKTEHLEALVPDSDTGEAFGKRTTQRVTEYFQWWHCMGRFSQEFEKQFQNVRLHMYKFLKDS